MTAKRAARLSRFDWAFHAWTETHVEIVRPLRQSRRRRTPICHTGGDAEADSC